jgi:hypothetical protein
MKKRNHLFCTEVPALEVGTRLHIKDRVSESLIKWCDFTPFLAPKLYSSCLLLPEALISHLISHSIEQIMLFQVQGSHRVNQMGRRRKIPESQIV